MYRSHIRLLGRRPQYAMRPHDDGDNSPAADGEWGWVHSARFQCHRREPINRHHPFPPGERVDYGGAEYGDLGVGMGGDWTTFLHGDETLMRLEGIGDTGAGGQDCGANPCTFLDSIYAGWGSPSCLPYLACMNPNDPRVVGALQSVTTSVAADVGTAAGTIVNTAITAAEGNNANLGTSGLPWYVWVGGAGVLALLLLSKK